MNGCKQFRGRKVLVTLSDRTGVEGVLWRVRRDGIELREATDPGTGRAVSGALWVPAPVVVTVQVVLGGGS